MTATLEHPRKMHEPAVDSAAIAARVRSVSDDLAKHSTTPPEVASAVHELIALMLSGEAEEWLAVEPEQALLAHRAALEAEAALAEDRDRDSRDRLRIALARLATALELIDDVAPAAERQPAKQVARWLVEVLDVPQREVAELLGVELRKLQRWLSETTANQPDGEDARRLRTVAKIAAQLRHVLSGPGVVAWFGWPRADLGGVAPAELLADPSRTPDLLLAAGSMRSTGFA